MGTRGRHVRVPILRPARLYLGAAILLACTFGVMLAAIQESFEADDWFWFLGFIAGATSTVVLYFCVVIWWLDWVLPQHAYTEIYNFVDWPHEYDHHSGEN